VLVNDKIDGHSLPPKCPSSVLQHSSSTEKVSSEQDQQELSSLGNNVGGKRKRIKRQAEAHDDDAGVVDVVFLGDGHANNNSKSNNNNNLPSDENVKGGKNDNSHEKNEGGDDDVFVDEFEEEKIDVIVEKRILLNISIGMDGGFGSPHLDVYHLQVAVPLPKQIKNKNFFSYNVVENDNDENFMNENLMRLHEKTKKPEKTTLKSTESYDDSSTSSSSTTTEHSFDDFIEASTEEGLKISFKMKNMKAKYAQLMEQHENAKNHNIVLNKKKKKLHHIYI
jgi:hypothetical protein